MSILKRNVNELLQKIKDGEDGFKEELFELTYNHLKIIARTYLNNKNDAEDVVQVAFLRAFVYIDSADISQDGYNWLCKIVQHEAYKFNKQNPIYLSIEDYKRKSDSKDIIDAISDKYELLKWLEGFSQLERKLIYLKFYCDYTYMEIAEILQMKKSTVYRRIAKILEELLQKREELLTTDDPLWEFLIQNECYEQTQSMKV